MFAGAGGLGRTPRMPPSVERTPRRANHALRNGIGALHQRFEFHFQPVALAMLTGLVPLRRRVRVHEHRARRTMKRQYALQVASRLLSLDLHVSQAAETTQFIRSIRALRADECCIRPSRGNELAMSLNDIHGVLAHMTPSGGAHGGAGDASTDAVLRSRVRFTKRVETSHKLESRRDVRSNADAAPRGARAGSATTGVSLTRQQDIAIATAVALVNEEQV